MNLAVRNLIRLVRLLTGAHFDGNHTISLSVALLGAIIDRQRQLVEEWSVWCSMAFVRVPAPLMIQKLVEPCPPGSAPMGHGVPWCGDRSRGNKLSHSSFISSLCEVCIFVSLLLSNKGWHVST